MVLHCIYIWKKSLVKQYIAFLYEGYFSSYSVLFRLKIILSDLLNWFQNPLMGNDFSVKALVCWK